MLVGSLQSSAEFAEGIGVTQVVLAAVTIRSMVHAVVVAVAEGGPVAADTFEAEVA